jgi:hypothetical protein
MILGQGQIFGEETLLKEDENALPLYTIKCKTALGEVLVMNESEF